MGGADVGGEMPGRNAKGQIQEALARISESAAFSRSLQLTAFLRFIIEEEMAGRGDRLKGYTIGVQALGRDKSFDPNSDPIVRVEARRLRQALKTYYAKEGSGDDVVIMLPLGTYRPTFLPGPIENDDPVTLSPEPVPDVGSMQESGAVASPQGKSSERSGHILKVILGIVVINQLLLMMQVFDLFGSGWNPILRFFNLKAQ